MGLSDLTDWLGDYLGPECVWFLKRLSGHETLANGPRPSGPGFPRHFLFYLFPVLKRPEAANPEAWFELSVDSHDDDKRRARAVWYNNRYRGGARDELRITNLGGARSALLDPENTGALAIFVFVRDEKRAVTAVHVWVCRNEIEEELVEYGMGPVDPGQWMIRSEDRGLRSGVSDICA